MFKKKKKTLGQITGEYALLLFIVAAVIGTMTVYVKRTLQGRIRDARFAMYKTIRNYSYVDPNGDIFNYNGVLWKEYEPYYVNRLSEVTVIEDNQKKLLPGATSGIYRETFDETTQAKTISEQLPPKDSD